MLVKVRERTDGCSGACMDVQRHGGQPELTDISKCLYQLILTDPNKNCFFDLVFLVKVFGVEYQKYVKWYKIREKRDPAHKQGMASKSCLDTGLS